MDAAFVDALGWPAALDAPPEIEVLGVGPHDEGTHRYRLPRLWCLHAFAYRAEVVIDGVLVPIRPGCFGVCPPGAELVYRFPRPVRHAYAHFRLPGRSRAARLSAMTAVPDYAGAERRFAEAAGWMATAPDRAAARLWDLLWMIAQPRSDPALPPLVERICARIESGMGDQLSVGGLAREFGCSPDHLGRLFRQHLRTGVVAYIRERRMRRARHLLRETGMPIAAIGALVGIPDPHHFNKIVRRVFGRAPRAVRAGR